jgi:hypothetical protein
MIEYCNDNEMSAAERLAQFPQRSSMFVKVTGTLDYDPIAAEVCKTGELSFYADMIYHNGQETAQASIDAFTEDTKAVLARLKKGDTLTVEGNGRVYAYVDNGGEACAMLNINATHVSGQAP